MAIVVMKKYPGMKTRRKKYGNKPVDSPDGHFDSQLEYKRWIVLKSAMLAGEITDLERQVEFPMEIGTDKICSYFADFTYKKPDGTFIVEDAKGVLTEVFRLKAKMLRIFWGYEIKIVKNPGSPV